MIAYPVFISTLFGSDADAAEALECNSDLMSMRYVARLFHTAHITLGSMPVEQVRRGFHRITHDGWFGPLWQTTSPREDIHLWIAGIVPLISGFLGGDEFEELPVGFTHLVCYEFTVNGGIVKDDQEAYVQDCLLQAMVDILRLGASEGAEDAAWEGLCQLRHSATGAALRALASTGWRPLRNRGDIFGRLMDEWPEVSA